MKNQIKNTDAKIMELEKEINRLIEGTTSDTQHQLFRGQKLTNVDFSNTDLTGSNFRETTIINCNFDGALLHYCNFKDSTIDNKSTFKNAKGSMSAWLPNNLPGLDMKTPPPNSNEISKLQNKIREIETSKTYSKK